MTDYEIIDDTYTNHADMEEVERLYGLNEVQTDFEDVAHAAARKYDAESSEPLSVLLIDDDEAVHRDADKYLRHAADELGLDIEIQHYTDLGVSEYLEEEEQYQKLA